MTRSLLDADYAAIEARIVAWLAGQEDSLAQYRAYDAEPTKEGKNAIDPYRILAAQIYSIPLIDVEKFPHRLVGKAAKLGCGFGMAAPKFRVTVKKQGQYDLPLGLEITAVQAYRAANKRIVSYWYDTDRAAKNAILRKGIEFNSQPPLGGFRRPDVRFLVKNIEGVEFLLIRLPSGRKLAYPKPRIGPSKKFADSKSIYFFGNIPGTKDWGEIDTYGGKLVENLCQATAADILTNGVQNAEDAGYQIATLIHDQALAYYRPGNTPEEFVSLLTELPEWADGLPVAAEGGLVPFYTKD